MGKRRFQGITVMDLLKMAELVSDRGELVLEAISLTVQSTNLQYMMLPSAESEHKENSV